MTVRSAPYPYGYKAMKKLKIKFDIAPTPIFNMNFSSINSEKYAKLQHVKISRRSISMCL